MFSKITGEFDSVEFAEFAAKHIREIIKSPVKISISQNRKRLQGHLVNKEPGNATHGRVFYMLPTAISSYNYITDTVSRSVNDSQISEPLLNRTVTLSVQADSGCVDEITGLLASYGGYSIKKV